MAEKEKDDTDKYLHKLEKKISGKLKKTDKNKKSLKRLLECLREERKKTKEEEEASGSVISSSTEATNVKTIAIDLKEGKQRIQLINSLISKSGESEKSGKKKEAKAKKKLEAAKSKVADRMEEDEEEDRGRGDIEEVWSRAGSSNRSKSSVEVGVGGSSRQEMDAKRLEDSESRIRSFESFARSSLGKKGGEKTKKEPVVKAGERVSVEPFLEENEGGFLDRVVPGKSKKKTRRDDREGERREEGTYKDRDMMVEEGYEEQDYRDQEAFWPGAIHRGPRVREISEDQRYRPRRDEYRGWEDERGLRGRREESEMSRGKSSWGDEGSAERRRARPPPPPLLSPHPPSSRLHPSIHINPHHPSNRSYAPSHEERWEGRRGGGYERRREGYREEGGRHREWVQGRRADAEELGRRRERYWAYEDEDFEDEDKLSEDDEDFAATGCRRANDDL